MKPWLTFLATSVLLAGCWVGPELAYNPNPNHPSIPKDLNLLRLDLPDNQQSLSVIGKSGSVWRIDMKNPVDGERRVHWLILFPDGRCLTSLRNERWRGAISMLIDKIPDEEGKKVRNAWLLEKHADSAHRIEILNSKSSELLRLEYESKLGLFNAPKLGRFLASENKIMVNIFELDPMLGAGIINYDTAAISRITFEKQNDCWKINESETKTIWWAPCDITGKFFGQDQPVVNSTRGIEVSIKKVDGFIPARLPDSWQW